MHVVATSHRAIRRSLLACALLALPASAFAEPGMAASSSPSATSAVVAAPAPSAPTSEAAKALISALEAKYSTVQSLQAAFVQISRNDVFGDKTSRGTLTVKRPAKMRWEFGGEKLFVTNGTKMWIYTVSDKQVIEYDDISAGRSAADSLLTSLDKLGEMFHIEVKSSDASGSVLALTPVKMAQFKRIELSVTADLMPVKVVMTDTFDQVTDLSFSDVKLNTVEDDSIFEFTAPAGVDVVKAATN